MSSMRNKTSTKKVTKKSNNTRVAMLTWSTNDVFLSVFQWTNMQMLQRYFMLHPIIPCHSLVTYHCGHVITSTIPFTYEREGVLIGEFIHSRFSWTHRGEVLWRSRCLEHVAKKLVKWSDISVAMLHNWPFEVVKTTGRWSSICSLISHVQVRNFFNEDLNKPLRLEALVFVRYHFASKWITVVVSSMYLPRLPRHSFQKCFF